MEVEITVTLLDNDATLRLGMEEGVPVAGLLRSLGLLALPCGLGKCGKCLIHADTEPAPEERERLGAAALASGFRLACHTRAKAGMRIAIPKAGKLKVLTDFVRVGHDFKPLVDKIFLSLEEPSLEDQRPDLRRLMEAASASACSLSLGQLALLPDLLRSKGQCHALMQGGELLGFSDCAAHLALVADIGTTTVAAMLLDLDSRDILAVRGEHNAQAPYGADVVSRIQRGMEEGTAPLQQAIVGQINALLRSMLDEAGQKEVSFVCLTGNTTMLHLLCGLPACNISRQPFIPVSTGAMRRNSRELGLDSDAPVYLPPGISAYIGADITTALLAADAVRAKEIFLLIDFGTNAETVLYANGEFYACSAAAGPCFEGATLSCGMAGQSGAIDTVHATPDGMGFTVLGGVEALGLCGSGCIDALALLLQSGHVDETGRLSAEELAESALSASCRAGIGGRIRDERFYLTPDVYLSQKDIREVQLAKAAVRAGIEVLLQEAGIAAAQIETLYMAGGFGSALAPASAARLGLIPTELRDRVSVLGNAAGFGALRYVTEPGALAAADALVSRVRYIELSAHSGFSNEYIMQMTFPFE